MKFMDHYMKCPSELQQSSLEVVITDDQDRDVQRQALQRVVEDVDDRDWRSRSQPQRFMSPPRLPAEGRQPPPQKSAAAAAPQPPQRQQRDQQQQPQAAQYQAGSDAEAPKIVRAADVGLTAYRPGGAVSGQERVRGRCCHDTCTCAWHDNCRRRTAVTPCGHSVIKHRCCTCCKTAALLQAAT